MDESSEDSARAYLETIEKRLQTLRGRPLLLPPEDLARVLDWHERGIPLELVLETMDAVYESALGRLGRARAPRSLAYCAPAIEEAWEDVVENRVGRRRIQRAPVDAELPSAIEAAAARVVESSAPRDVVGLVVRRLEAIAAGEGPPAVERDIAAELDRRLCEACLASLEPSERERLERAARDELAPYRGQMEPAIHDEAIAQAVRRRLRRRFLLPDLTLLPLL